MGKQRIIGVPNRYCSIECSAEAIRRRSVEANRKYREKVRQGGKALGE